MVSLSPVGLDTVSDIDLFPLFLSLQVAVFATGITLLLGTPLAWALARLDFPGRGVA